MMTQLEVLTQLTKCLFYRLVVVKYLFYRLVVVGIGSFYYRIFHKHLPKLDTILELFYLVLMRPKLYVASDDCSIRSRGAPDYLAARER